MERLQKVLARAGVASRRHSEALIAAGRVAVNGETVTEQGRTVDPDRDLVTLDGRPVGPPQEHVYLLLHKPRGYITTAADERGRPTVLDLLPDRTSRVFPVGRLDLDSEGLLLLTNDGDLAQRLTHPRYGVEREYLADLEGVPTQEGLRSLRAGAEVAGRPAAPRRLEVERARPGTDRFRVRITLTEGRKREVREIARSAGYPLLRLVRVRYGPLRLGRLPAGASRPLRQDEVRALRAAVGL